jgi:putative addiction module component (TIGR02574 family)
MNTSTIRQKLYEYIRVADDKKVKAIYTIIESEVNELYEWCNDKDLLAELDRRSADLKSGKVKGLPWEDVKKELLKSRKTSTGNGQ